MHSEQTLLILPGLSTQRSSALKVEEHEADYFCAAFARPGFDSCPAKLNKMKVPRRHLQDRSERMQVPRLMFLAIMVAGTA